MDKSTLKIIDIEKISKTSTQGRNCDRTYHESQAKSS